MLNAASWNARMLQAAEFNLKYQKNIVQQRSSSQKH